MAGGRHEKTSQTRQIENILEACAGKIKDQKDSGKGSDEIGTRRIRGPAGIKTRVKKVAKIEALKDGERRLGLKSAPVLASKSIRTP
jgi:hypothetical protein